MGTKILVVDDDRNICELLKLYLENDGYTVFVANDGQEAVEMFQSKAPELVLLDIMLPKMDGLQVCQTTREFSQIPIIMVTAKGEDMDKIMGLEYGADDYIVKPFNILELKARIKAILRRSVRKIEVKEVSNPNVIEKKGLKIETDSRRIFINGKETNLTAKEYDLLEKKKKNEGKVYSRENLLNTVWGYDYPGDARTVDVHIRRLREKIEANPSEPQYIFTKWGCKYPVAVLKCFSCTVG